MQSPLIRAACLAALLAFLALAGCGGDGVELDRARAFTAYPLYWLGEEFEGHRLTLLELPTDPNGVTVIVYGTCEPEGGDEPSCT